MANLIQIKRSTTTAVPPSLANGELAYTSNGNVLFIGSAGSVIPIAGQRAPGVLTANQALVANSTSGIDKIITSNAVVGAIVANGSLGTAGYVLTSNSTGVYWNSPAASSIGIIGDSGTDNVNTGEDITFVGADGITTTVANNQVTIDLDDTAVTPGTYGDANSVSSFTVDQQGRLTSASNIDINHNTLLNFVADEHVAHSTINMTAGAGLTGGGNIAGSRTFNVGAGNGITVNADDVAVNAGVGITANSTGVHVETGGDSSLVANSSGLFVDDSTLSIATTQLTGEVVLGTQTSGNYVATVSGGNGLTGSGTGEGSTPTLAVGQGNGVSVSADAVAVVGSSTVTVNASGVHVNPVLSLTDLTLSGNLDVNGTITTIDTQNLSVNDSIIELARNNAADSLDIGFYGTYNDGTERYTGLIWDTSTDVFELFANTTAEPTTTLNTGGTGYVTASLKAYLQSGGLITNSSSVSITANSTVSVGIVANTLSLSSVSDQDILVGNTTGGLVSLGLGADGLVLQSNGTALVYDSLDGGTF